MKAILLDRDNTLNYDPGYLNDAAKVRLLDGVVQGLSLLKAFDYKFFILTNQAGVAKGKITYDQLNAVNARLLTLLEEQGLHIERMYICPHRDEDNCECRKPGDGLVKQLLADYNIDTSYSYLAGDRYRDISPGMHHGIKGILIPSPETQAGNVAPSNMVYRATDMNEAAGYILENEFNIFHQKKYFSSYTEPGFVEKLGQFKDSSQTIVFTNGCFDLLHPGHLQYLWQARQLGDRLIVGVNDDASVKRLKGQDRPVNSLESRLLTLANLPYVDVAAGFGEDTPIEMLKQVKPGIHVKGGDYIATELPEYELVKQNGGEVIILPFRQGFSTTLLIKKMNRDTSS